MIIYHYDRSGVFLRAGEAKPSPADGTLPDGSPRAWLVPARATKVAPPKLNSSEAAVFNEETQAWAVVEDHRGQAMYSTTDGSPSRVTVLGPVPDGYTLLAPPDDLSAWNGTTWVPDLEKLAVAARAERDAKLAACDFTQLADVPLTSEQKAAWAEYRQALRDYMAGWYLGKPWPEAPA